MSKPVVFVIGASGSIGTATVTALASSYGDKLDIRAGVRNPEKADKLRLANVSVVRAEMGTSELQSIFKGVDSLYIVVPGAENRAELTIKTAEAAKAAGVKFLLVVSVLTADCVETIFGRQANEVERKIKSLGVPFTLLRLPYFTDNVWGSKDSIKGQGQIYGPVGGSKPFVSVVTSDAGVAAAAILADVSQHTNKTYQIISHRTTQLEIAESFSRALDKEVKYVQVPYEDAKKAFLSFGMMEWQVDGVMELFKLMDSGSPVTNTADLGDFERITGKKPIPLGDYIASISGAFK